MPGPSGSLAGVSPGRAAQLVPDGQPAHHGLRERVEAGEPVAGVVDPVADNPAALPKAGVYRYSVTMRTETTDGSTLHGDGEATIDCFGGQTSSSTRTTVPTRSP